MKDCCGRELALIGGAEICVGGLAVGLDWDPALTVPKAGTAACTVCCAGNGPTVGVGE